jgi:hypothetical protein
MLGYNNARRTHAGMGNASGASGMHGASWFFKQWKTYSNQMSLFLYAHTPEGEEVNDEGDEGGAGAGAVHPRQSRKHLLVLPAPSDRLRRRAPQLHPDLRWAKRKHIILFRRMPLVG